MEGHCCRKKIIRSKQSETENRPQEEQAKWKLCIGEERRSIGILECICCIGGNYSTASPHNWTQNLHVMVVFCCVML
jgi:hypothetical protein